MRDLIEQLDDAIRGNLIEAKVSVVDFVSGQEPNDDDDDWAADMELKVSISGKELAQMLGKQERVLARSLEKLTPKKALAALTNGRNKVSKAVLRSARKAALRLANEYARDEFGSVAKVDDVEFNDDESHWSAKIDAKKGVIDFVVEIAVSGEWK